MDLDPSMPFSVTEQYDYQMLLDEAIETILTADEQLGPQESSPNVALEDLVAPLRRLKEAQAFFATDLTVQSLTLDDFKARRLKPAPDVQKWLRTHRLYLIQIPVTLKPAIGWAFTRLECGVVFKSVGAGPEAKAHDIYPDDIWAEVLHVRAHLKLGLDAELKFRAELPATEMAYLNLSGGAQARLTAEASGGAQLLVGPLDYEVRRPQVRGRGREGSTIFWELDGRKYVEREEPYLAIVLRVPNEVPSVNVQGRLIVYHRFNFLSTHPGNWTGAFRDKLQSFFSTGIPLEATAIWNNVIM